MLALQSLCEEESGNDSRGLVPEVVVGLWEEASKWVEAAGSSSPS